MDINETGWETVGWIKPRSRQGPMKGYCQFGCEPSSSVKGWSFYELIYFRESVG
jgi:hypothetical protein